MRKQIPILLFVFMLPLLACGTVGATQRQQPPSSQVTPQATPAATSGNMVTVIEEEFKVTFQPAQLSAGDVTFVVKNQGNIPHNFHIQGNGIDQRTAIIMPQQSTTLTVYLSPGTYNYECGVEGHSMAGMHGTLTVQANSNG